MRRRAFLVTVAFAVVVWTAGSIVTRDTGRTSASPSGQQGQMREFTLLAEPVRWEIQPGLVVDGWGYNGQIPGPTLRVTEGDTVRVHLINHLPEATTIHWHGVDVPAAMDGVPGLSQDPVEPGDSFTYEFTATNPGTRMYHSHTDTDAQIQLGLYGAFIIDPRQTEPEHFDREFTYILTEKSLDFTPQVAMGQADILHRDSGNGRGGAFQKDLFLMNGRAGEAIGPMTIAPGSRIRIRLINLGNMAHAMHLHGQSFRIIATDGNPVPPGAQLLKDTVLIGPAERFDLAVDGTNPGVWMFHCHINNHAANGMTTVLQYDGHQPLAGAMGAEAHGAAAPPLQSSEGAAAGPPHPHGNSLATALPSLTPPSPATLTGSASGAGTAAGAPQIVMMDNRYVPTKSTVPAGTTVVWMNNGNNMHNTTSLSGLWDSGLLTHGQTFSYTFDKAGTYQFLCSQHFLEGMRGTITVTPP